MKKFAPYAGWIGLFFAFTALFTYIIIPSKPVIVATLFGFGLLNLAFFAVIERASVQRALTGRIALYGANSLILTVAFIGILVFVNLISYRHKHRFDLTEGKFYTLSPQTKKVVSTLTREVKMTAFFQMESAERTEFNNLAQGFAGLSEKIKLEFVDPDKNPAITKQYGIKTYGTVVLESGKNETKIKGATEENLTNGIIKVIQDKKKNIYFLDGHGERSIDSMDKEGYSTAKAALEKDGHKVEKLLLLQTGKIPDDSDLLTVAGPVKSLLPQEVELVSSYLNHGGAALVMIDPQTDPGLTDFLSPWGIELNNDLVIDPLSRLFGGDYAAPVVNTFAPHDITKDFALATVFPLLRSVTVKTVENVESIELLKSGPNSWAETDFTSDKVKFDEGQDRKGPVAVAVITTKKLDTKTAGEKAEPAQSPDKADMGKTGDSDETQDTAPKARLMVIGDADFAANNYFNVSGNGDFFLNTASWLVQKGNLISIRPKERKNTPIQITREQGTLMFLAGVIGFPAAILIAGIRIWWRRRAL